jgi:hypothetical protein
MNNKIQERIFLVGCPRSGTTLLQSMLAANSRILSFPETHFFGYLFMNKPFLSVLNIASRRAKSHWNVFLDEIGHPELHSILPRQAIFVRQYSTAFIQALDLLTLAEGKTTWVEKTPGHLRYVNQIERLVKGSMFIHIVRNGLDNIASLYEMGQKYPETWGAGFSTLDQCIQRWVKDICTSQKCSLRNNHHLVNYEQLASDPKPELMKLCEFIRLNYEESMLTDYPIFASKVIQNREQWKASVFSQIEFSNKFDAVFDGNQQRYILEKIPPDLLEVQFCI